MRTHREKPSMSWYFYVRMSHRQSAESGLSEQSQLRVIEHYFQELSVHTEKGKSKFPEDTKPGNFIDRGVSGWSKALDQRPAGIALLKTVQPGDHIIFYSVDRAFRNTEECLRTLRVLGQNDISCHFATEQFDFTTASGKFMLSVMAAVAAYQSDLTSERTREANAIKRLTGQRQMKKGSKTSWDDSSLPVTRKSLPPQPVTHGTIRIYNRVSTLDQKISGLSMQHQRQSNESKAKRLQLLYPGLANAVTYEDESVSAYKIEFSKRPSASRMLADLVPGDHVVIYRADRAFRNTKQSCEFVDSCMAMGVTVHLTKDGISSGDEFGRMFFKMLSMFAEMESAIKSRRKLELNDYLASRGRPIATIPFQYKGAMKNGKKHLKHDLKRLQEMACCWVARRLGYSYEDIHEFMYAYKCAEQDKKPGLKRPNAYTREKANAVRFEEIYSTLPKPMISELVTKAIAYLSQPIDSKYTYWCKKPLPLDCTEDRLDACGISQVLQQTTPTHALSATAPA
jgi:DNA invertase Pin-like site-specific DNA recombinase